MLKTLVRCSVAVSAKRCAMMLYRAPYTPREFYAPGTDFDTRRRQFSRSLRDNSEQIDIRPYQYILSRFSAWIEVYPSTSLFRASRHYRDDSEQLITTTQIAHVLMSQIVQNSCPSPCKLNWPLTPDPFGLCRGIRRSFFRTAFPGREGNAYRAIAEIAAWGRLPASWRASASITSNPVSCSRLLI